MEQSRGQKELLRKCPPAALAGQSGLVKEQVPSAGLLSHGPPPLHPISHPRHWGCDPVTSERGQRHTECYFFPPFTRYSRSCDSIRGMKSCMSLLGPGVLKSFTVSLFWRLEVQDQGGREGLISSAGSLFSLQMATFSPSPHSLSSVSMDLCQPFVCPNFLLQRH